MSQDDIKIFELALELGRTSTEIMELLVVDANPRDTLNHMSVVSATDAQTIRELFDAPLAESVTPKRQRCVSVARRFVANLGFVPLDPNRDRGSRSEDPEWRQQGNAALDALLNNNLKNIECKQLQELVATYPFLRDRQSEVLAHNNAIQQRKAQRKASQEINQAKAPMRRVIRRMQDLVKGNHTITLDERKRIFAALTGAKRFERRLDLDFWQMEPDPDSLDLEAAGLYSEGRELFSPPGNFERCIDEHNERVRQLRAAEKIRPQLPDIKNILQYIDDLLHGCTEISKDEISTLVPASIKENLKNALNSSFLEEREATFVCEAYDLLSRFPCDAWRRNEQFIKPRLEFIKRVQEGKRIDLLYCLTCSRAVNAEELDLKNVAVETFDEILVCKACQDRGDGDNALVFAFDYLGGTERYICIKCEKIAPMSEQQFDPSASGWYCAECYALLPVDGNDKPMTDRNWEKRFETQDRRDLQIDDSIEKLGSCRAAYLEWMPREKRTAMRDRRERFAKDHRYVDGEKNDKVPLAEQRFLTNVLRHSDVRRIHEWKWTHQKVLCDDYVVDFYCEVKLDNLFLVIELDGPNHLRDTQLLDDQIRDAQLRAAGYKVLRIWNARAERPYGVPTAERAGELRALVRVISKWIADLHKDAQAQATDSRNGRRD